MVVVGSRKVNIQLSEERMRETQRRSNSHGSDWPSTGGTGLPRASPCPQSITAFCNYVFGEESVKWEQS